VAGRIRYIEINPMTSSGIEPATFLLVAYHLNQLPYCVPNKYVIILIDINKEIV
jgi:hypothetical protein